MEDINIHKVVVRCDTYDIVSADMGFYAYINDNLYYTFDDFVEPDYLDVFSKYMKMADGKHFVVSLCNLSECGCGEYLARVFPCSKEGCVELRLISASRLVDDRDYLMKTLKLKNAVLELYNDAYFVYDVSGQMFKIYKVSHYEKTLKEYTIDELKALVDANATEEEKSETQTFLSALMSGERELKLNIQSSVINLDMETAMMYIKGSSIYINGEYTYATGSIHIGRDRGTGETMKEQRDSLTGVLARAEIKSASVNAIDVKKTVNVAFAIIDIDYFKKINDTYGHKMGDKVLKQVASLIEECVGTSGIVGRYGGDEFIVLYYDIKDRDDMRVRLRSLKNMVQSTFPVNDEGKPAITLSIGSAIYPRDAQNYEDIFMLADFALYRAKEKGRNRYVMFESDKHGVVDDIRDLQKQDKRINNRGDMSLGDIVCTMMDRVYRGEDYPVDKLLDDIVLNSPVQRILVYAGKPSKIVHMSGQGRPDEEMISKTQDYMTDEYYESLLNKEGFLIINDIRFMENRNKAVYEKMKEQGLRSYMQFKFKDKSGVDCVVSFETVTDKLMWNQSAIRYYRLIVRLLSEYAI